MVSSSESFPAKIPKVRLPVTHNRFSNLMLYFTIQICKSTPNINVTAVSDWTHDLMQGVDLQGIITAASITCL